MAAEAASFTGSEPGPLDPAAHALVQSDRMVLDAIARGFDPPRISVISNGVDVSRFQPVPRDSSSRPLRVVLVARVGYAKGVHYAGLAVRRAGPRAVERLTVVGRDANDATLLRQQFPDVTFTGDVPHIGVRRYLDEADVFLLPTLADSMARAIFEAMACGLPVITTLESGYEGIMRDGVEGFFVDGRDVEGIADRLQRLSADGELRQRMGAAARALAEQYSWERFEDRFRAELSGSLSFLRGSGAG
jgi:glycosyltransferase involved in cell wall biosynthesis